MSSDPNYSTQSQTTTEQQIFSEHERDVTGYLFAKLIVLYANDFYLVYPSEKEVKLAKQEYAKHIGQFSRDQIDLGLRRLAKLAISPESANKIYREPNLPAILAMMNEDLKRSKAHQLFLPVPPDPPEIKAKRYEEGVKQTTALLAMLSGDE